MYIILSGSPKYHQKHQKIIKFPIIAIHTYVFAAGKQLRISENK